MGRPHGVPHEVRALEREHVERPAHVSNHSGSLAAEVVDLVSVTEPEPIRRDDPVGTRQERNEVLPARFGTAAELTTMQKDDGIAVTGIQIVGADSIDYDIALTSAVAKGAGTVASAVTRHAPRRS